MSIPPPYRRQNIFIQKALLITAAPVNPPRRSHVTYLSFTKNFLNTAAPVNPPALTKSKLYHTQSTTN